MFRSKTANLQIQQQIPKTQQKTKKEHYNKTKTRQPNQKHNKITNPKAKLQEQISEYTKAKK